MLFRSIKLVKKTGDKVSKGDVIAVLYSEDEARFKNAEKCFIDATHIGANKPESVPLILDIVE